MAVVLARGLQDSVAGADVVHEEISVGMQGDGSKRGRNCVRATIDFGSGGSSGERFDVASRATDLVEKRQAFLCRCAAVELRVARGRFAGANEAREVIDIGKSIGPGRVVRLRDGVAEVGDLVRLQAIGDAHFIEVGVAGER